MYQYSVSLFLPLSVIVIDVFVYLSYFTMDVLITNSTVATADMWVGLGANILIIEK